MLLDGEMPLVSHSSTKEANLGGCDGQKLGRHPFD